MRDITAIKKLKWPLNSQVQPPLNADQSPHTSPTNAQLSIIDTYAPTGCLSVTGNISSASVYTLYTGQFTWTIRNRCAHVHEAEGATWKRLPAARATGDFWLGGWAADTILAEAAALVRHRRAAVGNRLPTEVAAHKHLSHRNKHKGWLIRQWTWRWN